MVSPNMATIVHKICMLFFNPCFPSKAFDFLGIQFNRRWVKKLIENVVSRNTYSFCCFCKKQALQRIYSYSVFWSAVIIVYTWMHYGNNNNSNNNNNSLSKTQHAYQTACEWCPMLARRGEMIKIDSSFCSERWYRKALAP